MKDLKGFVDKWKIGKLNHFPEIEKTINWKQFYLNAKDILKNENIYWKKDLLYYIKY